MVRTDEIINHIKFDNFLALRNIEINKENNIHLYLDFSIAHKSFESFQYLLTFIPKIIEMPPSFFEFVTYDLRFLKFVHNKLIEDNSLYTPDTDRNRNTNTTHLYKEIESNKDVKIFKKSNVLEMLGAYNYENAIINYRTLLYASRIGSLPVIKYLFERFNFLNEKLSESQLSKIVDNVCSSESFHYNIQSRYESPIPNRSEIRSNRIECLSYFVSQQFPFSTDILENLCYSGDIESIDFIYSHFPTMSKDELLCNFAIAGSFPNIVPLLHERGFKIDCICLLEACMNERYDVAIYILNNGVSTNSEVYSILIQEEDVQAIKFLWNTEKQEKKREMIESVDILDSIDSLDYDLQLTMKSILTL
jgi:hypothetical protein